MSDAKLNALVSYWLVSQLVQLSNPLLLPLLSALCMSIFRVRVPTSLLDPRSSKILLSKYNKTILLDPLRVSSVGIASAPPGRKTEPPWRWVAIEDTDHQWRPMTRGAAQRRTTGSALSPQWRWGCLDLDISPAEVIEVNIPKLIQPRLSHPQSKRTSSLISSVQEFCSST